MSLDLRDYRPAPTRPPICDGTCCDCHDEDDMGLRGGQGRTLDDLRAAEGVLYGVGVALGMLVVGGLFFWALYHLGTR